MKQSLLDYPAICIVGTNFLDSVGEEAVDVVG